MKKLTCLVCCMLAVALYAQDGANPPRPRNRLLPPTMNIKNPNAHDPVLIKEGDMYYLFTTGRGVSVMSSSNLETWNMEPPVFTTPPQWAVDRIPTFRGHIWAPDIIYYQGRYHVFYSCSAFAKNTSAIGHASTKTLNSKSPDYGWTDHGMVVESRPYRDMWNAIDANIIIDEEGTPWMSFGSFWDGIKLVKLTADLKLPTEPQEWYSICRRPRTWTLDDANPGDGAVEAPFIYKHGEYYYLFVSYDYCCRGNRSDYKVVVGRSEKVMGPYLDKDGKRLDQNGGTVILQGNEQWAGVGHNGVHRIDDKDYFVAHAYVKAENGASKLIVRTLSWQDGWPIVD